MRRTASEVIHELETRIAQLEGKTSGRHFHNDQKERQEIADALFGAELSLSKFERKLMPLVGSKTFDRYWNLITELKSVALIIEDDVESKR
jgi:dephospho-CoA kinase